MTTSELHELLDDENKKISLKEFREILHQLKNDCGEEMCKSDILNWEYRYYCGEQNAFYIALDLSEHIEDKRIVELEKALELACICLGNMSYKKQTKKSLQDTINRFKEQSKKELENE